MAHPRRRCRRVPTGVQTVREDWYDALVLARLSTFQVKDHVVCGRLSPMEENTMTVKDLKEMISDLPDDQELKMDTDDEVEFDIEFIERGDYVGVRTNDNH